VSTQATSKQLLLDRLRRAEEQAASLDRLKQQIQEAVAQVDAVISGSATGVDRKILAELQVNLDQLDRLVMQMRAAVIEGRRFADSF
jgi:hypothetical protein